MTSEQSLRPDTRTITTGVRPPRVAVFLDNRDQYWMHTCLRIIEWSTAHWGGWYTCIIPTDGKEIAAPFWTLLEAFDPDYLYIYRKTGKDRQIAFYEEFEREFEQEFETWMLSYPDQNREISRKTLHKLKLDREESHFELSIELKAELHRRLNAFGNARHVHECAAQHYAGSHPLTSLEVPFDGFAKRLNPDKIEEFCDYEMTASVPVQLMVYSLYGKLWDKIRRRLDHSGNIHVFGDNLTTLGDIGNLLDRLWDESQDYLYEKTAAAASLLKCSFYYPVGHTETPAPLVFVLGDAIEDYCLFHSLSRMRRNVIWLPECLLNAYRVRTTNGSDEASLLQEDEEQLLDKALALQAYRMTDRSQSRFTSVSMLEADLQDRAIEFLKWLADIGGGIEPYPALIEYDVSNLLPYARRLYETNNDSNRFMEQFHTGDSLNLLNPPRPKHFGPLPPTGFFWITETTIKGYKLPARPQFGPSTIRHVNYDSGQVRVTSEGFGFFCPYIASGFGDLDRIIVRPTIHLMSNIDVFRSIFQEANYDIRYSDKGNYQLQCTAKFGGLEALSKFLTQAPYRNLLAEFTRASGDKDGYGFRGRGRRYFEFKNIQDILGNGYDAVKTIEDLTGRGVLYRGFVFQCEACRNADWYPIEEVTHTFTCSRCRVSQRYTVWHWREPNEPQWFYELDEIVYQAFSHNFHVPVLTLRALQRRSNESFLYVPELELRNDPKTAKPDCELDVCCCVDGVIIIGECKLTKGLINTKEIEKQRLISEAIRADRVVFSTLDADWGSGTEQNVKTILDGKAEMLSSKQLLTDR